MENKPQKHETNPTTPYGGGGNRARLTTAALQAQWPWYCRPTADQGGGSSELADSLDAGLVPPIAVGSIGRRDHGRVGRHQAHPSLKAARENQQKLRDLAPT
jgi:hypothetical protein